MLSLTGARPVIVVGAASSERELGFIVSGIMGHLEEFVKRTFVEAMARVTGGAVEWQGPSKIRLKQEPSDGLVGAAEAPRQFVRGALAGDLARSTGGAVEWRALPELQLGDLQCDGFLVVRRPQLLEHLAAPWPEARLHAEVMLELELGDSPLDRAVFEHALLVRQARQVQRLEEQDASWLGEEPLWLLASHLPEWLQTAHEPVRMAPGCYSIGSVRHRFLWIAANELPLHDELLPFLMARSGRALDEFGRWVAPRQPREWVLGMLAHLPMSTLAREDLRWRP